MKQLSFLFFLLFLSQVGSAQINFTLKINDTHKTPLRNITVTAENKSTNVVLTGITDQLGSVKFELVTPGVYTFHYLEMKNVTTIEVLEGFSGNSYHSLVYDPKGLFAEKPKADRNGIIFRTLTAQQLKGQDKMAKVIVYVKDQNKKLIPDVAIAIVSPEMRLIIKGKSNARGEAIFYAPIGLGYEIDVENIKGFSQIKIPNSAGIELSQTIFFEKLNIVEKIKGDTIMQSGIVQTKGTSTHLLFTLLLKDYSGNPLAEEPVYAQATKSKRVYAGKTDSEGKCSFMLEKGDEYILNLKYESGLYLIKVKDKRGYASEYCERGYRGSKAIEELMAEQAAQMKALNDAYENDLAKINSEEFRKSISFQETPVKTIAEPEDYLTKTADGFSLNFKTGSRAGVPTIVGDKMFAQAGLYSSDYYCLNAKNGSFNWGLRLGESGISPAVYHKGILLINTASCTLYAIDAETGKLLWSKWLSTYVYSTPTADDNNVYVTYNHGGYPVLASFDLRSGELNWLQLVDDEILACPVVEGSEVHLASQSGQYYVFNKADGKLILKSNTYKIVSSPTLTEKNIYVTASILGKEYLLVLDRKTLKLKKKYNTSFIAYKISKMRNVDETDQMNFNGSHPIVYKNKYAIITSKNKIMVFDIPTEKLVWKKVVSTNSDQIPIIANEKIILITTTGDIMSFDLRTGQSTILKKTNGKIEGQPIAKNGLLYLAAGGIITVFKTIQSLEWVQWNKDANHNLFWK